MMFFFSSPSSVKPFATHAMPAHSNRVQRLSWFARRASSWPRTFRPRAGCLLFRLAGFARGTTAADAEVGCITILKPSYPCKPRCVMSPAQRV